MLPLLAAAAAGPPPPAPRLPSTAASSSGTMALIGRSGLRCGDDTAVSGRSAKLACWPRAFLLACFACHFACSPRRLAMVVVRGVGARGRQPFDGRQAHSFPRLGRQSVSQPVGHDEWLSLCPRGGRIPERLAMDDDYGSIPKTTGCPGGLGCVWRDQRLSCSGGTAAEQPALPGTGLARGGRRNLVCSEQVRSRERVGA
ncbi:hypothetical protein BDY21DRAFT_358020 [Lineolata rhizophorae]|uniref:Uncharacterized protein n=1 Tax=Lineolata rhizophorae TaxID=578093 RepID=A0A6A6NM70_9PEZI|nr:hypothetical protein BDY21DRAFT_358020 [Lineolata rhizophorae]